MKKLYDVSGNDKNHGIDIRKAVDDENMFFCLVEPYEKLTQDQMDELRAMLEDARRKVTGKDKNKKVFT